MDKSDNIIINVGRQIGSGGHDVARLLAERFACKFYDKEILNLAARESGFSQRFFEQNDEHKNFFRTLFNIHTPFMSDNSFYKNDFSQESLFRFQSEAIRKAACEGNCVFVGRCADYVLRDMPNCINIFITADMESRVNVVAGRLGCSKEDARKAIVSGENKRSTYYNFYTGKQWGHCESYDLCVNTSRLGIERSVDIVTTFIENATNAKP
ncbi:MAG: cytidylate kinase-like family protein [Prevotella sp.]|nr:cytidylate kinase-like family protein [Prevotella sp.]